MAGRGKKKYISPEDMARAEGYALDNCQNGTIEGMMGWEEGFIFKRKDIARKLLKKRQQHKVELRADQRAMSHKQPAMAIFLGKNVLGQADKQEITGKDGTPLVPMQIQVQPEANGTENVKSVTVRMGRKTPKVQRGKNHDKDDINGN